MPLLNLSFLTREPLIANDGFTVNRRAETVGDSGRQTVLATTTSDQVGAVYPTGSNQLNRNPDKAFSTNSITIVTRFRLQMTSPGFQPDVVEWPIGSGNHYVVSQTNNYSRYGAGFIEAQCEAIDAQQNPPAP